MQKMPPFKRETNGPKSRKAEMQPSNDTTELDVSLNPTEGYERSEYHDLLLYFLFQE